MLLNDFRGGLWIPGVETGGDERTTFVVPESALLEATNVEYLPGGGVRGRRGRRLYGSTSAPVRSMFRHYPRKGQNSEGPSSTTNLSRVFDDAGPGIGTEAWVNETNVQTEDDTNYASVSLSGTISHYLRVGGFMFTIPLTAQITGIQVEVKRRAAAALSGVIRDFSVRLAQTSLLAPAERAYRYTNWPRFLVTDPDDIPFEWTVYGGPSDTWDFPWEPVDFNTAACEFLIAVEQQYFLADAQIDHVRMTVFWTDEDIEPKFIIAREDGGDFTWEVDDGAGNFSAIPGAAATKLASADRPRLVNWPSKNKTFIFDGLNPLRSYNGNVIETVPTNGPDNFAPRRGPYATLWHERLWASDPAESNFSVYASDVAREDVWTPSLQISVNDPQGGTITGLVAWRDRLLIFKSTCVFSFVGDIETGAAQLELISDEGCTAPDSIQVTPWGVVYAGRFGIYVTDGASSVPIEVSEAIRALFISRLELEVFTDAIALYVPRLNAYWLALESTDTDNLMLQRVTGLSPRGQPQDFNPWARVTSRPMRAVCVWAGEADEGQPFVADELGNIFECDTGTDDAGEAIGVVVLTSTHEIDPEERRRGRVCYLKPLVRTKDAVDLGIRYDQHDADDLTFTATNLPPAAAEILEARVYVRDRAQFGRWVAISVSDASSGPHFELHRIDAEIEYRSNRRWIP